MPWFLLWTKRNITDTDHGKCKCAAEYVRAFNRACAKPREQNSCYYIFLEKTATKVLPLMRRFYLEGHSCSPLPVLPALPPRLFPRVA